MFCEEDCELPISWRENEETLRPQNTDTHRDDKHPAEAVYPPTDQTRHTDVSTDQIKEKNHFRVNLDSKATKSYI